MRRLLSALLAVVLTVPVFLVLTRIDAIPGWLYSERGYAVLDPLFRMFGAVGVEGHEDVVAGVLLVASFVIAVALVWGGSVVWRIARGQCLRCAADHRRNRFDHRPHRRMLATQLAHQTHCALSDFRGKLGYLLVHGSILSRVGASTKSGAVHIVMALAGRGPRYVVEVHESVGRPLDEVCADVKVLVERGVVDVDSHGCLVFPYDRVRVGFEWLK